MLSTTYEKTPTTLIKIFISVCKREFSFSSAIVCDDRSEVVLSKWHIQVSQHFIFHFDTEATMSVQSIKE